MSKARFSVVAQGSEEPINLTEAKAQCKVETSEDDDLIKGLISAARVSAEHYTGWQLIQKRLKIYLDEFPAGGEAIELDFAPIREIQSIQYIDEDGNTQTWSSSNYLTDLTDGLPPRISEAYDQSYPTTREQQNAVWITADVGPRNVNDVSPVIKAGMKLEIAHYYDNRTDKVRKMPTASENLYHKAKRSFL